MKTKIFEVQGPDGQVVKVEAPENATDEQILGFLQEQGPEKSVLQKLGGAARDLAVTGATGAAEAVLGIPATMADINNYMSGQTKAGTAKNPAGALLKKIQDWEKRNSEIAGSSPANVVKAGVGGMAGPGNVLRNLGSGLAGGLSSETAAQFTDNPLIRGLAGMLGTGATSFATAPSQSQVQQNLRRETMNMTPQEWAEAQNNIRAFGNAGARTATLAEAVPGDSGLKALAQKAAGQRGGEELRETLAGRGGDLSDMSLRLPRVIGPEVDTNAVAAQAAQAAKTRFSQVKAAAQRPLDMLLRDEQAGRLPPIPQKPLEAARNSFEGFSRQPGIPAADVAARTELLEAFNDPNADPRVILEVLKKADPKNVNSGLNLDLREAPGLQDRLSSLLMNISQRTPAPAGSKAAASVTIDKSALNRARQSAFDLVNDLPAPHGPRAAQAGADYLARKQAWLQPRNAGPLRQIAGNTDPTKGPITDSRLNAILDSPFPGKTPEILRELEKGGGDRKAIATALLQKELEGGTADLAGKMAGASGSPKERQLMELIGFAGGDTQKAMDMLTSSRELTLKAPGQISQAVPDLRWYQALIRPFRTIDMMGVSAVTENEAREISRLIGQKAATPEGLAELRKMAEFDPMIRSAITIYQTAQGAAGSQREGQ